MAGPAVMMANGMMIPISMILTATGVAMMMDNGTETILDTGTVTMDNGTVMMDNGTVIMDNGTVTTLANGTQQLTAPGLETTTHGLLMEVREICSSKLPQLSIA